MPTIRDVLNKIKWSQGGLHACEITITHRGAPDDLKIIRGDCIRDIAPRALIIEEGGEEVIIPYHRIRVIKKGGLVIWRSRRQGG